MTDPPIKKAYRPADAAKWLGVTTNTVRMWCGRYAEFLSEDANPEKGRTRSLTQRDMMVFKIVADRVNDKLMHDEIAEQLVEMGESIPDSIEGVEDEPESPQEPQEPPEAPLAPATDQTTVTAIQAYTETSERIAVVEDRTERNESQMDQQRTELNQYRAELNQYRWLLITVLLVLVVVVILLLIAVMR